MTKTFNTAGWGQPGQMQVDSKRLVVTTCLFDRPDGSAEWANYWCDSAEEFNRMIDKLETEGYHLVG